MPSTNFIKELINDGTDKVECIQTIRTPSGNADGKTTRAAGEILDGEMERRQVKTARLRKARLEREASPAVEVVAPSTSKVRNKPPAKAIP